jgi:hypothetical protein
MSKQTDFIAKVAPMAQKGQVTVLPSVTIALACLESNYFQGTIAQKTNNICSIFANVWKVPTQQVFTNGSFKYCVYKDFTDAILGEKGFIAYIKTYSSRYAAVIGCKDYHKVCQEIMKAGYAGICPTYASALIGLIEHYKLTSYDIPVATTPAQVKQTPVTIPTSVLRINSRGNDVKILQTKLDAKGFNCGVADGIWGKNTDKAVRAFQKANHLTVDGIVGPKTWGKLF